MLKNWTALRLAALACVIISCAYGQEIHLKTRVISTATASNAANQSATRQRINSRQTVHQIVEFNHPPGAADLDALLQLGAQVTAALPDDAVVITIRGGLTNPPAGVIWIGNLEAQDKISPALTNATFASGTTIPVIVEFHSDIDAAQQTALGAALGVTFLRPAALVAQHVIVEATPAMLATLSEQDEIAYIFPADPSLLAGTAATYPCAGMLTTVGPIAQYANVTHGWDLDSDNIAHLTYYFGSLTSKVPTATVQSEIERALNTWSANLNVTFTQSTISSVTRSIYIEFASGEHGDSFPFTEGSQLAHTFYPVPINAETIAGDMHFNADEPWAVGADTDIYTVALHEIGHALGLSHSDNPGDVMYPYYHRGLPLSANDIGAAKQLYTPANQEAPVTATVPVTTTTATTPTTTTPTTTTGTTTAAPLTLTADPAPVSTSATVINVTGIVTGGAGPYTVRWQTNFDYSGTAVLSAGSNMWTASNITLAPGANIITITADDAMDHVSTQNVTITMEPPSAAASTPIKVTVSSPSSPVITVNAPQISISGNATGGAGITQVTWKTSNGASGVASGVNPWAATAIPLPVGTTTIIVNAYDAKGATAWATTVAVRP